MSATTASAPRLQARMAHPLFAGALTEAEATARGCRLVTASHGVEGTPQSITLTLLVDGAGTVRDARWQSTTTDAHRAAYDIMAELTIGRSAEQFTAISPRVVDAKLREPGGGAVLDLGQDPDQPFYVLVKAAERCRPAMAPVATGTTAQSLPWNEVGLFERVRRIEAVLDQHVRPALANDGGGIDLVDLNADELSVQYQGACGSCSSSIGGTLQFVQDSLNNHLGTNLSLKVTGIEESMFA